MERGAPLAAKRVVQLCQILANSSGAQSHPLAKYHESQHSNRSLDSEGVHGGGEGLAVKLLNSCVML